MGRIRKSTALILDGSETSAAPVSPDGCVAIRATSDGSALEASYDGAAWGPFSGGGGSPAGSGTELQYRNGAAFGAVTDSSVIGGAVTLGDNFVVRGDASRSAIVQVFAAVASPLIGMSRGRGTIALPTAVQSGDSLGSIIFAGQYSSTVGAVTTSATIRAEAQANFTATNDAPTDLLFTTKFNTTGTHIGIRLTSQQLVGIGDEITHSDVTHRLTVVGDVKLNLGSDATGDVWYRAATTGTFTRLGIGSTGQVLTVAAGLPSWAAASSIATPVSLADGGTGNSLSDPGADRLLMWDDSSSTTGWLAVNAPLAIIGSQMGWVHLGIESLTDPGADRVAFWDESANAFAWLTIGTGLSITGTTITATGGGTIDGSGTANTLSYWVDSDTLGAVTSSAVSGANLTLAGQFKTDGGTKGFGLYDISQANLAQYYSQFGTALIQHELYFQKASGTQASPGNCAATDFLGTMIWQARNAGAYATIAQMSVAQDAGGNLWEMNVGGNKISLYSNKGAVNVGSGTFTVTAGSLTVVGAGRFGITTGQAVVVISDTIGADLQGHTFNATGSTASAFKLIRGRGTEAAPTAVQSGDLGGSFTWFGQYGSSVGQLTGTAQISVVAQANFTATSDAKSDLLFSTKSNTSGLRIGIRLTSDRFVGIGDEIAHASIGGRFHVLETDTAVVAGIIETAASSTADCLRLNAGSTTKVKFTTTSGGAMNSVFGSAALAASATDGFIYLPTCAPAVLGAPTGTPTSYTGLAPIVYDSVNHKIWIFSGSWRGIAVA